MSGEEAAPGRACPSGLLRSCLQAEGSLGFDARRAHVLILGLFGQLHLQGLRTSLLSSLTYTIRHSSDLSPTRLCPQWAPWAQKSACLGFGQPNCVVTGEIMP